MSTPPSHRWEPARDRAWHTLARNLATRYLALAVEMSAGLLLLPFNLRYLGETNYGLWILLGSVTMHFSLLEMGNGSAMVKFVAQYRARKDARAINEIGSSMAVVFCAIGVVCYALVALLAFNLEHVFRLSAAQAQLGQWILLIIGLHVALNFPFSVYGGITGGFQRYDINNAVAVVTTLLAAAVNVGVVLSGYGLLTLVASTTAVRVAAYVLYAANARRVFPELALRPTLFRKARVREVLGFSTYTTLIDWANKLNYQLDTLVIGVFMGPVAVAVWTPAERIAAAIQRLANQLNGVLFPLIVDSDTMRDHARLQQVLVQGTRFSVAIVLPICAAVVVLADPLIHGWLGDKAADVAGAIPVVQVLAIAVAVRVANGTSTTLLKGTGKHRMLAAVNITTGIVNVALSALLVGPFGLMGVAYGTLVPISVAAIFVLFPAACRRAGLAATRVALHGVFPAVWPALPAAVAMWWARDLLPATLPAVALWSATGGLLYALLFVGVAVGRDRALYVQKMRELIGRRSHALGPNAPVGGAVLGGR